MFVGLHRLSQQSLLHTGLSMCCASLPVINVWCWKEEGGLILHACRVAAPSISWTASAPLFCKTVVPTIGAMLLPSSCGTVLSSPRQPQSPLPHPPPLTPPCVLSHRLAGSEWAYELGVVGEDEAGSLNLAVTYRPFQDLDASSRAPIHARGALFVTVRQCQELPSGDWDSSQSDPYVLLKVRLTGLVTDH